MGQHCISAGDSHKPCSVKIGVPYASNCSSSIVSSVLSPLRRSPLAVLFWRMSRGDAFRGALVWRFGVGGLRLCTHVVGRCVVRLVLRPSLFLLFLPFLLPLFLVFSASASKQPKPAL